MIRQIPAYLFRPFDRREPAGDGVSPSHRLLARALSRHTGLPTEAFGEPALTPRGKPRYSAFPDLHFSISHSGELWLCAVGDRPLGLDVQRILTARRAESIARRFFHPEERAFLAAAGDPDAFFTVWTAKESYVKYTGQGIDGNFAAFAAADADGLLSAVGDACLTPLAPAPGYAACLCTPFPAEVILMEL